jgi:NAD dependent epimerase/dehydratase family enzyme
MNFYGNDTNGKIVDENAPKGSGFLSDVTEVWENEAFELDKYNVRVVTMRISMILDPSGGALGSLAMAFKFCLGGVLGNAHGR